MAKSITEEQMLEALQAYHAAGDNISAAARSLGLHRDTISSRLAAAKTLGLVRERNGKLEALETTPWEPPAKGKIKRYLLTSAQNGTKVHTAFWNNLNAMAIHYDATLMVSGFFYNKNANGQASRSKGRAIQAELPDEAEFAPEVREYLMNDRIDLAPRLTFCGELNILPTARRPLMGMENYTYRKSTIVPHATIALKSVAGMKEEGVKLLYTTGACTQRNYIKRREGFRAEHFHAYAALLVEVNDRGNWWCRQVEQGDDGTLCDLTLVFKGGRLVRDNARVANICRGDIHASKLDEEVAEAGWRGEGNMLDTLRPYSQHIHDILDCGPFGHHTRKDAFENYRAYHRSDRASMAGELRRTGQVVAQLQRPWCRTVAVNANHDRHLERDLKETDWRRDSENAETMLMLTAKCLRAIRVDDRSFNLVETAIRDFSAVPLDYVEFLHEDQSDIILKQIDGGIECGAHGDRGANGAQGTPVGFARMGRKMNVADKHVIEIIDLVYVSGLNAKLDMGYNKGMSSWTHGDIVTYNNSKRAILSYYKGEWRA